MAETSAGWLIPAEAGETPTRRAFYLLGAFLDDDQKVEAESGGGFSHRVGERLYWIPLEGAPRCAVLDEGRIEHLCIAPRRDDGMPQGDVALTYLLWLKADPEGFLAEANVLRTEPLDPDLGPAELRGKLAEIPRRPPRPRRRRKTPLNRPGLARGSSLRDRLDADALKEFLARNGRSLPADVAERLGGR